VIGVKPLDGVVVLDLTRFLAGPYCTLLLAGLGAEVIRVEPPGGDLYRAHPPFGGPKGTSLTRQTDDDLGLALLHRMRGKKSVTLNLRAAAGVDLFRRLSPTPTSSSRTSCPARWRRWGSASRISRLPARV